MSTNLTSTNARYHVFFRKIAIQTATLILCVVFDVAFSEQQEQTPKTTPSDSNFFVDPRDGKRYRIVTIGKQTWMAYNLNYKIGNSWCYMDDNDRCKRYGRLYDWNTAMKACPDGWRLPSRKEWQVLVNVAGGNLIAGKKLKSKTNWDTVTYPDKRGTDSYGFSALPGGARSIDGDYFAAESDGQAGYWWTATESEGDNAYRRFTDDYSDEFLESKYSNKNMGFSVRCVQN